MTIETVRVYKAFIDDGNEPNGPMQYFSKVSQILDVARLSLYAIEGIISDCIMVSGIGRFYRARVTLVVRFTGSGWFGIEVCALYYFPPALR